MMLTEEEARRKWCPHARVQLELPTEGNPPVNRDNANIFCMASLCMAWRWVPMNAAEIAWRGGKQSGNCGAFGRPQ